MFAPSWCTSSFAMIRFNRRTNRQPWLKGVRGALEFGVVHDCTRHKLNDDAGQVVRPSCRGR